MNPRLPRRARGFTLLEVLVALVIVGTALGASLRAVGSLATNSSGLRTAMMATWSAENRLVQVRLSKEFPAIGKQTFPCPQGDLKLVCQEEVLSSPNPMLRRVEVSVYDAETPERRIIKLVQLVLRETWRARGFTLVELLVAISILAIVAVLGWRGLDGIVRARVALTEQMETTRGMQLAFAQMQSDCEHMVPSREVQQRPTLQADAGGMTLVRNVYIENTPSQLQVISYRIHDGVLQRRESMPTRDLVQLDMLWKTATSNADSTPPVSLQSGVMSMQVEIWENNAWRVAAAPPPVAPGGEAPKWTPLPATGLRVALQVQNQEVPMSKAFLLGGM